MKDGRRKEGGERGGNKSKEKPRKRGSEERTKAIEIGALDVVHRGNTHHTKENKTL